MFKVLQLAFITNDYFKLLCSAFLMLSSFFISNAYSASAPAKQFYLITSSQAGYSPLPTTRFSSPSAACAGMSNVSLPLGPNDISREYTFVTKVEYDPAYRTGHCSHNLKRVYQYTPLCCNYQITTEDNFSALSFGFTKYYVCENNPNDIPSTDSSKSCEVPANLNPKSVADPRPDPKAGCNSETTKNPISYSAGNKVLREVDYSLSDSFPLMYERTYNSTNVSRSENNGEKWLNAYNRYIPNQEGAPFIFRQGGKAYPYMRIIQNGAFKYISDADVSDSLERINASNNYSWRLTDAQTGHTETYRISEYYGGYSYNIHKGNISSISDRAGLTQTMKYSCKYADPTCPVVTPNYISLAADLLIDVSDPFGRSLRFTYDSLSRIKTMINPAGGVYTYAYDANNNLSSVTYPDLTVKTYHYGEVGHVAATPASGVVNANLLTGITDEKGNRYADYYYDAQGRAFDENLAGGAEATNLVYNTDGSGNPTSTVVTDSLGNVRTHNFTTVLGVAKSTGQSQPSGSGCAAAASALTYDANGNVASRVDFNGNKTTYVYDMARNLETSRTEGLTTAGAATTATRTITTTWHATWRLPLVVSEYNGASATGTPLKRTTTAYDSKGNITSYIEEDPVRSLSRTTTTTYTYSTAVPGLVLEKVVDGPRPTDIDRTIYTYYPHDATCIASTATPIVDPLTSTSPTNLGCRGQLLSVLRPVGITTYDRYNHHGQLEQMTDPNGVVTEFIYDLRQRLTSETTGTESTQFTYDNAGLLVQTKFPDNSELNYIYDNAHRLTEISNTTGDKVVYTLDSEGNRTQEVMYDAYGSIAKSLTRQFDALNRAQQVTGE